MKTQDRKRLFLMRYAAVLAEAAGEKYDHALFEGDPGCRERTIDLLESLGYIEARCDDGNEMVVTGITPLGRAKRADLVRDLADGDDQPEPTWGKVIGVSFATIVAIALLPFCAHAQDAPPTIATDRPGQTTPPAVQSPGTVQFELAAQYAGDAVGEPATTFTTLSVPSALVRMGVVDRMEIRIATEFRSVRTEFESSDTTVSGLAGVSIGTKVGVAAEEGAMPETALLVMLGLPQLGSETFRPIAVAPSMALSMRNALSSSVNLYYNVGAAWNGSSGAGTGLYSVLLSPAFTPEFYGFVEIYGALATGVPPMHAIDAGVAYVLAPNLQLDLFGGVGITEIATDYFANVGISLRLPR
jgi:hypothetical protein